MKPEEDARLEGIAERLAMTFASFDALDELEYEEEIEKILEVLIKVWGMGRKDGEV